MNERFTDELITDLNLIRGKVCRGFSLSHTFRYCRRDADLNSASLLQRKHDLPFSKSLCNVLERCKHPWKK